MLSKRLTNEELTQIRERAEKATEGNPLMDLSVIELMDGVISEDIPRLLEEIERLREGEDKYINELETEVFRLQDELAGDGVLTLSEQLSHARADNERLYNKASEYASIALWCARRLATRRYAEYAYDEIERIYGYEVAREWRGGQL